VTSPAPLTAGLGPLSASFGISLGHRSVAEADHWIRSLGPAPALVCTHLVTEPFRHVAISVDSPPAYTSAPSLTPAAAAAGAGRSGRAVIFAGVSELVGELTVSQVLELSAIDRVEVLGGGHAPVSAILDTRDFVRPQFRAGKLVLTTMPASGGVLVPFETRDPTPCCAEHL
jgi:hypothetical protein